MCESVFVNNNCIQLLSIYNYSNARERGEPEGKLIKLGKKEKKVQFNNLWYLELIVLDDNSVIHEYIGSRRTDCV